MKLSSESRRLVLSVALGTAALSALLMAIYVATRYFTVGALIGAALSTLCASLNFYLLARSLEKAAEQAVSDVQFKARAQVGYLGRILLMIAVSVIAIVLLEADPLATLLPYIFSSLVIKIVAKRTAQKEGGETKE